MTISDRYAATEAELSEPTDWAALGARILAAARQAVALHMVEVARHKAQGDLPEAPEDPQAAGTADSAEPTK